MRVVRVISLCLLMLAVRVASGQVRDSVPLIIADSLKAVYIYADTGKAINRTDGQGRKQGLWEKRYSNGKLRYRGHFHNDNPRGVFKYYWDNDSIQNISVYSEDGRIVYTKMFYENGGLYSIGKYVDQKRDSVFVVYNEYSKLSVKEQYVLGKKEGKFISFYPNGNVMEVKHWHNNLEDGAWQQFFDDGQLKLEGTYIKGKLQGKFKAYDPGNTETPAVEGSYLNDLKNGPWIYYNMTKNTKDTVVYKYGRNITKENSPFSRDKEDSLKRQNQELQQQLDHPGNRSDGTNPDRDY